MNSKPFKETILFREKTFTTKTATPRLTRLKFTRRLRQFKTRNFPLSRKDANNFSSWHNKAFVAQKSDDRRCLNEFMESCTSF